ncbi:zinc metalloprotease HtpX [Stappia sp. ES.058]|uniref:zinc metalloprotease HtpX n=1 Tax=Stappia sp. ES.058 TaxID=1881061 RepID=UPI00087D26E3|nr:zinc metalloprotease HtpX [Stappia sp. ES.058]SDT88153.1 heat shock protein HtpX [Stappia sp. ES.058]
MLPVSINAETRDRYRRRNRVHTLFLAFGAIVLLGLCAWTLAGPTGVVWAAFGGGASLVMATHMSPHMVLGLYGARKLSPHDYPQVHRIVRLLSERAGLAEPPRLYRVPSRMMNAFSTGRRDEAVICMTDALIARLDAREFVGVMAHELAHIVHEDITVMALADIVSRMTAVMSALGLFLVIFNLPALLTGGGDVPYAAIVVLIVAPTLGTALQLGLSRTREYEADLGAAALTGDPDGLAKALLKLERVQGRMWEAMLPQGARIPDPSVLRTHPVTDERVRRLEALKAQPDRWVDIGERTHVRGHSPVPDTGPPRRRLRGLGAWY